MPTWKKVLTAACAAGILLGLAGCDPQRIAELKAGESTETDVREKFGEPLAVYEEEDGSRVLEYTRQPEGDRNYMITIGPEGQMLRLEQVLTLERFSRVLPGLEQAQVRRLLGRPAQMRNYPLKQEDEWTWRFSDGQKGKLFSVSFDKDGRVLSTATVDDERLQGGG